MTASQSPTGATSKAAYGNSNTGTNPTAEYQPSSSTDAQNNATAYTYDGAGNLQQSADALPATAKVTYNSDGTPATSTDPKNGTNSTSYTYNSLHQLTKITPPTGNSLQAKNLTYDGFGRVATITDGAGNTLTYTYDNADRITKAAYTGGTHTVTVSYGYDGAGNLKTQTDPSGTTSYTYDGRNKVLTKNAASGGGTLTYNYDADANLTLVKDAGGSTSYTYNTRNLLASLTDPAGKLWQFAYNADGLRTTTWFATNTANTTWSMEQVTSYDKADRISRIQVYDASSTSNVVSDTSYCYSPYVSGQACPTTQCQHRQGAAAMVEKQPDQHRLPVHLRHREPAQNRHQRRRQNLQLRLRHRREPHLRRQLRCADLQLRQPDHQQRLHLRRRREHDRQPPSTAPRPTTTPGR